MTRKTAKPKDEPRVRRTYVLPLSLVKVLEQRAKDQRRGVSDQLAYDLERSLSA